MDLDSNLLKSFNSEFGRTIFYTYNVSEGFYIEEPGFENIVKIYPNPTDGIMNVDIKDLSGSVNMNIYNMQGALVRSEWIESGNLIYDLSAYPAGLYFLEVQQKGLLISGKIIKR